MLFTRGGQPGHAGQNPAWEEIFCGPQAEKVPLSLTCKGNENMFYIPGVRDIRTQDIFDQKVTSVFKSRI